MPSMKVTVPVGVLPPPVTVAVNVTDPPYVEAFPLLDTAVELAAFCTSWEMPPDVLPTKSSSRLRRSCVATPRAAVEYEAHRRRA